MTLLNTNNKMLQRRMTIFSYIVPKRNFSKKLPFPTRSWISTKKTESGLIYAATSNADVITLDMEDAVHRSEKDKYREFYREMILTNMFKSRPLAIRINAIDDGDLIWQDIARLNLPQVFAFIVPKAENSRMFHEITQRLEKENGHNKLLIPVIESSKGYANLFEIAQSSDKICALFFGNQDFSSENFTKLCLNSEPSLVDDALIVKTALAAKNAGIEAIGAVNTLVDPASSEKIFQKWKRNGFDGAVTLTLPQTAVANREFSLSEEERRWANFVINKNDPMAMYSKTPEHLPFMVGPPHEKMAIELLERERNLQEHLSHPKAEFKTDLVMPSPLKLKSTSSKPLSVGMVIENNYSRTIRESWLNLWSTMFINTNPLYSSDAIAQKLGYRGTPVPPLLQATLGAGCPVSNSLSAEKSRVQLGLYNGYYIRPVYVNETLTVRSQIVGLKNVTKNGKIANVIVTTRNELINQHNERVFTVDKKTLIEPVEIEINGNTEVQHQHSNGLQKDSNQFRSEILSNWSQISKAVPRDPFEFEISQGQVLFHDHVNSFTHSDNKTMGNFFRARNGHIHNIQRFSKRDILVMGPLSIAATASNADVDFGNIVYEELIEATNLSRVNIGDQISTITYVKCQNTETVDGTDFEVFEVVQLGVKSLDLVDLKSTPIPLELFNNRLSRPLELEKYCLENFTNLLGKIVCRLERKIVRQKP